MRESEGGDVAAERTGEGRRVYASNGTVVLQGIWEGEHTLTLYELSQNCSGDHLEALPIVVHADSVIAVTFRVTCKAIDR